MRQGAGFFLLTNSQYAFFDNFLMQIKKALILTQLNLVALTSFRNRAYSVAYSLLPRFFLLTATIFSLFCRLFLVFLGKILKILRSHFLLFLRLFVVKFKLN